jgi:putative hemolysin
MKKNYFLLSIMSSLLLLGAGCSFGNANPTTQTSTTTLETVRIDTTAQQEAYLFCIQKGYDIQIRYIAAQNRNIAYCVIDTDTECESIAFQQGTCPKTATTTPENALSEMFEPVPGDRFPLRLCDPVANPVCGIDNNTYTNGCVAEFLGVKINHAGSCDQPAETAEAVNDSPVIDISLPPKNTANTNSITKVTTPTVVGTSKNANTNTWVEIPLSLLQSTAGSASRIDRCTYGGTVTFYVHSEFPTLYNAKGEAICYPEHDINNSCPTYITSGAYTNSCTKVSK